MNKKSEVKSIIYIDEENKWWFWNWDFTRKIGPYKSKEEALQYFKIYEENMIIRVYPKIVGEIQYKMIVNRFIKAYGYNPVHKYMLKSLYGVLTGISLAILIYVFLIA